MKPDFRFARGSARARSNKASASPARPLLASADAVSSNCGMGGKGGMARFT